MGVEAAWNNRTVIYLASAAMAEFIADIFLCPLEATRIRSVSDPSFPQSLPKGFARILSTEGPLGFYAGFGPILFKQVPYTMAKFAVQGKAAEIIYKGIRSTPDEASPSLSLGVSLSSGVVAGVAAAIISHPADTLLSKINKAGAGGTGSTVSRLTNIAREMGFLRLCTTGLGARCVMIGSLTAGQFGIFDSVMNLLGAGKTCVVASCRRAADCGVCARRKVSLSPAGERGRRLALEAKNRNESEFCFKRERATRRCFIVFVPIASRQRAFRTVVC